MKRFSAAITILGSGALANSAPAQQYGVVRSVVDGDTIWVQFGRQMQKIRLSHIDAPELAQSGGELAKDQLQELLPTGTQISVAQLTTTREGLMIAEVTNFQGDLVNLQMVQQGAAIPYHPFSYGGVPTIYSEAAAQAQLASAGVHGMRDFMNPTEFRMMQAEMPLAPSPLAAFAPALPSKGLLGIGVAGGLGLLGMVVLAKVAMGRKTSTAPSLRQLRSDLKKTQKALQEVLTSQKLLERQYDQAQLKAEEWLQRADLALKSEDQALADQALVQKGTHTQQADEVKRSLDEVTQQVTVLRQTVVDLETQIAVTQMHRD